MRVNFDVPTPSLPSLPVATVAGVLVNLVLTGLLLFLHLHHPSPSPEPAPNPPHPVPAPSLEPTDAFYQGLKAAWLTETHPGRADRKGQLAAFYRQMIPAAQQPTLATVADLRAVFNQSALALFPPPAVIPATDKVCADYVWGTLPKDPAAALDAATRAKAAQVFGQVAADLDLLK